MKKKLIFYGYFEKWSSMYEKDTLIKYLNDIIDDVLLFDDINKLKKYLELRSDNKKYKIYILPSRIHHIHELNNAGIKSLFNISSYWLHKLEDKKLFSAYVVENKLNNYVPKYFYKSSKRNSDNIVIIKPRDSCFSFGVYKKKLKDVADWEFDEYVVQEYIYDNKEYDGVFVVDNGKITLGFAYISKFETNDYIKFDNQVPNMISIEKIMLSDKIKDTIELFLIPCSYTGTCCFDFKIVNNNIYIFEINPRLDGAFASPWNKDNLCEVIRELIRNYNSK